MKSKVVEYAISLFIIATAFSYYQYLWGDLDQFVISIDHCDLLFCDFVNHYYPTGKVVFDTSIPNRNYFYTSFFAILLHFFAKFEVTTALKMWMVWQIFLTSLLYFIPVKYLLPKSFRIQMMYLASLLISYPILHHFKWGQMSTFIVVAVLTSYCLFERGKIRWAAFVLALAISVKYYAILFLFYFAIQKKWKLIAYTLAFVFLLVVIFPVALMGLEANLKFYAYMQKQMMRASRTWMTNNIDSQFFVNVVDRISKLTFERMWNRTHLRILSYMCALSQVLALLVLHLKKRRVNPLFTIAVLFLITPLWIDTSWPHYFVYLPLIQIWILTRSNHRFSSACKFLSGFSIFLTSLFCFQLFPSWEFYNAFGIVFFANTLVTVATWLELAGSKRKQKNES